MLGVNQSDFMSYMSALKTNYRKGIHRMEAILANPTHAAEFAANLGGVSVVLGVPIELPDRNSDKLLELLLGSTVADDAVLTWMHQFYEFTDRDDLMGNAERCKEMANNPLIWRAAGGSKLAVGKSIATLAGLSCADYADIDAVAASQVAMTAVAASQVAMAAIIGNSTALNAVVTSQVAMAAVAASAVALNAICKNATARSAFIGSSYRDTYYSKILSSLQNTAYFTVVINAGAMTNTTSLLYYNGTEQAVSTALSADDSFILIPTLQSYNSSSYCYVYDLQTGSTIAHYTHDRLTTANLVIPGGVRASNIYGGSGHTTYYVFKAK